MPGTGAGPSVEVVTRPASPEPPREGGNVFLTYIKRSVGTDRAGRPLDVTPDLRSRLDR
jgi:hypothetical protein